MADVVVTLTVPLDRLPAVSAAILGVIDSPDQMTVERVEDTRRPARSVDWQERTKTLFTECPYVTFGTRQIVNLMHEAGIKIDRATVSRYLSSLHADGFVVGVGEGRYRRYRLNHNNVPLTDSERVARGLGD